MSKESIIFNWMKLYHYELFQVSIFLQELYISEKKLLQKLQCLTVVDQEMVSINYQQIPI